MVQFDTWFGILYSSFFDRKMAKFFLDVQNMHLYVKVSFIIK